MLDHRSICSPVHRQNQGRPAGCEVLLFWKIRSMEQTTSLKIMFLDSCFTCEKQIRSIPILCWNNLGLGNRKNDRTRKIQNIEKCTETARSRIWSNKIWNWSIWGIGLFSELEIFFNIAHWYIEGVFQKCTNVHRHSWILRKTGDVPFSRRFTWAALTHYIASSPVGDDSDDLQDHHWKLQFNQCGLCTVDYNVITHLEHAASETRWILEHLNLTGFNLLI